MGHVVLRYPHYLPSREPRPMKAAEIWRVAEAARRQLCPHPARPLVEIGTLIARCRRLEVNDLAFETHWECGQGVRDEAGQPVLGATEHDEQQTNAAMIYLNGDLIADRVELARSTALHELGHAVFDVPGWIARDRIAKSQSNRLERRYRICDQASARPIDWREWRANEFMGAFLLPRRMLHANLVKRAASLGLPLVTGERSDELPVLRASVGETDSVEMLAIELADLFGVSPGFVEVRLRKYDLITGG